MAVNILLYTKDSYLGENINFILCENPRLFKYSYFTNEEKALDYIFSHNDVQCILADREFINSNNLDKTLNIVLGEETVLEGEICLDVYQKQRNILDDLEKICNFYELMKVHKSEKEKNVISFYSTQGGSGKSTLAYCCAVYASKQYKTAYLNLELSANTKNISNCNWDISPEEYLCAVKENKNQKDIVYKSLLRNSDNVYVMPTPSSILDAKEINEADVQFLIDTLLGPCQVERLIVDLSCSYDEVSCKAMENSSKVVLVYADNSAGNAKLEKILKDPAFSHLALFGKEFVVKNFSKTARADNTSNVMIPIISGFEQNMPVDEILSVNNYFSKCCEEIIKL